MSSSIRGHQNHRNILSHDLELPNKMSMIQMNTHTYRERISQFDPLPYIFGQQGPLLLLYFSVKQDGLT